LAVEYLNDYSNAKAQEMLARWKQLAIYLIVKYNDMIVKPDHNSVFERTATGIGAKVSRPGYPKAFAKKLIGATGDKFACPSE